MTEIALYGADIVGQSLSLAGCTDSSGRMVVDLLQELNPEGIDPGLLKNSGSLRFSVPEENAIIKRITINPENSIDGARRAEFEFATTLLDDMAGFYTETHSLNGGCNFMVFGYHRHLIDKQAEFFESRLLKPIGFSLRSWSLASGYLNYCRREGGETLLLLDLSQSGVSYCFIKDTQPVLVGYISGTLPTNGNDKNILNSFLSDLKATVQYQMSLLFKAGYSTPLSLIVASGLMSGAELNGEIEERMKIRTIAPSVRTELFADEIADKAGKYLVSLGLTVIDR